MTVIQDMNEIIDFIEEEGLDNFSDNLNTEVSDAFKRARDMKLEGPVLTEFQLAGHKQMDSINSKTGGLIEGTFEVISVSISESIAILYREQCCWLALL